MKKKADGKDDVIIVGLTFDGRYNTSLPVADGSIGTEEGGRLIHIYILMVDRN